MKRRKIEFRFWDKRVNQMFYRKPLTYDFYHEEIIPLQYAGVCDKYGVKIFEGDVVEHPLSKRQSMVRFVSSSFCVGWDGDYSEEISAFNEIVKVVGNIYEL